MKKVVDTNILIKCPEIILTQDCIIPSTVILELESIKTSGTKSEEIKCQARNAVRILDDFSDKYEIFLVDNEIHDIVTLEFKIPITNDNLIIASAFKINRDIEEIKFITNDLLAKQIGKSFGLNVSSYIDDTTEEYKGYLEVCLSDNDMAYFYENPKVNAYNCLINQYLIIKNNLKKIEDVLKWDGNKYCSISKQGFKSKAFGNIKPLDDIQKCAFDSIVNNDITLLYGKAGCGKTTIPLANIIQGLETQKYRKCYIIYSFEPLKNAKTLGFEKGTHEDKILMSASIGNILSSKFGSIDTVRSMLNNGSLEIIPTANIRGVEFSSEDVVFVTEAQNLDIYTIKTIIQRCKEGCKQIYEGDLLEQKDINNGMSGMARVINVFKGNDKFGCIKLKNNYRSEMCELADKL